MTARELVCTCEDVTRDDVERAFARGHTDMESVRRYTGLGTGPCQGKSCVALAVRELLRLGATPAEVAPFTARPRLYVAPYELAGNDGWIVFVCS